MDDKTHSERKITSLSQHNKGHYMFFNSRNLSALSLEQILKKSPAVFAQAPHERTSEKYLFIPTEKILSGLLNNGWSVVSAVQTRSRVDHSALTSKHAIMLMRTDMLTKTFDVNDIMPMLKLENSHNGLSSFQLQAALFRKVCANGLTVPESMLTAPRVRHSVNIDKDTIEASFKIIQDFPKLMGQVDGLRSIQLSNEERMLFADSAARLIFDQEQIERTNQAYRSETAIQSQLLGARRSADRQTDLWTTLNVIQENAIRGHVKVVGETGKAQRTRAVSNIDRDTKINTELMTLAQKMAELKGQKVA